MSGEEPYRKDGWATIWPLLLMNLGAIVLGGLLLRWIGDSLDWVPRALSENWVQMLAFTLGATLFIAGGAFVYRGAAKAEKRQQERQREMVELLVTGRTDEYLRRIGIDPQEIRKDLKRR